MKADTATKPSRKQQILEALAAMLETSPSGRITTAALAKQVGVSEAALYRHFPSKTKMFSALIEFIEQVLFDRIAAIKTDNDLASLERCEHILFFLLGFAEKNPGLARIMTGDALNGEDNRLKQRMTHVFERVETELKQIVRDAEFKENQRTELSPAATANLILALAEGKICQYVRSGFKRSPMLDWSQQWQLLSVLLLVKS